MRNSAVILAVLLASLSTATFAKPIERIRPSDGIDSIRINANSYQSEIHVTFSNDMIALGGGHGDFPVRLEGPGRCDWGWRGPRTISCLLGRDELLPLAQEYTLVIDDGLTNVKGEPVPAFRLEFETDRPVVRFANVDWLAPTSPVIRLQTNVPVSRRELKRRVTFRPLDGSRAPIGVNVKAVPEPVKYVPAELQYIVEPRSALAPDTPYSIHVEEGLRGVDGGLSGESHAAGSFRTHAAFEFLGIGCGPHADRNYWEQQHPLTIPTNPDCAAEQPVALLFSAEPDQRGLYKALVAAGLEKSVARTFYIRPLAYQRAPGNGYRAAKYVYGLSLSGFPANTANTVRLPETIVDRFGRPLAPTEAKFPTRGYIPAFLNPMSLDVIASGSGTNLEFDTVNTDTIAVRLHTDTRDEVVSLEIETGAPEQNEPGKAILDVEDQLGKASGILVGEAAITPRALTHKDQLRGRYRQYARLVGAILSPWDVIVASNASYRQQRFSVWVSALENGDAIGGATVEVLARGDADRQNGQHLANAYTSKEVLGVATTDTDGYADIELTKGASARGYATLVRVTKGETVVVLPVDEHQFGHNRYSNASFRRSGYYGDGPADGASITWGVTDKPLYRRGETARIKGYVRIRDDNQLLVPARRNGWKLACDSYRTDLCAGKTVDLDEYGAFNIDIDVSASAVDGDYRVFVQSGPESAYSVESRAALSFRVASYKPSPHRVLLDVAKERIIGDDPIPVRASAEYFAGGALRDVDAVVQVEVTYGEPPVPIPLLEAFTFGAHFGGWQQTVKSTEDAKFDSNGRLAGEFSLPDGAPVRGTATITVGALHDGSDWAFSDKKSIEFVQERYLLGLSRERQFLVAGETYNAKAALIDLEGRDDESLTLVQSIEYHGHRRHSMSRPPPDVADQCTVPITPSVPASCELTPTRIGSATIRARLMRGDEEILQTERSVTVTSSSERHPFGQVSDRLKLELDSVSYAADDVATVTIDVPYDRASVILSAHRSSTLKHWREVLRKGRQTIAIPLSEKYTPGFTLTAVARPIGSGAGTAFGSISIDVESRLEAPEISIVTDRKNYKTGETVRLKLNSSAPGRSQLMVAVIDEAVLDLVDDIDARLDPRGERFMGLLKWWREFRWWQLTRAMRHGKSSPSLIDETLALARRVADREGTANLSVAPEADPSPQPGGVLLRERFVEAAYFNPTVLTSKEGMAELDIVVPDNLGEWRIIVVGASIDGQLFSAAETITVSLPLEVRASLPARLVRGDAIEPSASVLNRKQELAEVTLSITIDGDSEASASKTARLENSQSLSVSTGIGPVTGQGLRLTATAGDGVDSDGVAIRSSISDTIESRRWTLLAPLSLDRGLTLPIALPENALVPSATLQVGLDKSVIGDVAQVFHYMSESSHRSWEQILSRAVVAAYAKDWESGAAYSMTRAQMLEQLAQAVKFQTSQGGMSHFEPRDDRANDYLSAYTLLAINWIDDQGFETPAIEASLSNFIHSRIRRGQFSSATDIDTPLLRDMPILIAALSSSRFGKSRSMTRMESFLLQHIDDFDVGGLSYALIAATNIDASSELRRRLVDKLRARLVETFDRMEISGSGRFGKRNELYCVVLNALLNAKEYVPEGRVLTKLVRGGYEFRDTNTGFGNTHANAVCMNALTQYRDAFEHPSDSIAANVSAPGTEPFSIVLDAEETSRTSEAVPLVSGNGKTSVEVDLAEGSAGYASTIVQYDVDLSREIKRSHGYTIKRQYSVYRRKAWRPVEQGSPISKGEWVRIELDIVSPVVRQFVAISDPMPAGLEPVDASLSSAIPGDTNSRSHYWTAFNRRALSSETSKFYAQWLSSGSHNVTYYAQARYAGDFLALPAKVESMYSDGVFATTTPQRIRIESESP